MQIKKNSLVCLEKARENLLNILQGFSRLINKIQGLSWTAKKKKPKTFPKCGNPVMKTNKSSIAVAAVTVFLTENLVLSALKMHF